MLFDDGQYSLINQNIFPQDPLQFEDSMKYSDRLKEHKKRTSLQDAVLNAEGKMGGIRVIISAMEFAKERSPFITVSCSGGARMQEGVLSLMQLMKTSSAIANLNEASIPFISVLADPTTGGVTASFAMLGDINIAEPNALIGFAGPRVIEQTIKEKLPKGFQRSEFLLEHGMLDDVVNRKEMRSYIIRALNVFLNRSE
jgi:acetyl-CoA carboxylase carboxyl transferase subunit beta